MIFSLSSKRWLGTALAVALGLASAYADGKSEKIQFSGPGGSTNRVHSKPGEKIKFSGPDDSVDSGVADNGASRLNSQPGAFRQAQEAILAPFINMMQQPADSMEGVLAMPKPQQPQNTQASRRARQLLDQRQNWAFTDYNDLNGGDSTVASLDGSQPGASEDKSVSLVERYYQRLGRKQPSQARSLKDAFNSAREYATHDEDWDPSNSAFMTDKKFLKQLDTFGANTRRDKDHGADDSAPAANLFGDAALPDQNASAAAAAQQRRDDFQKILNPNFVSAPVKSSLNPIYTEQFGRPVSLAASPAPATSTVRRNPLNLSNPLLADPTAVALRSSVYDNPTDTALGLPTPAAAKPQVQPMTLEKMQSMVDPMAVFKKRNF